MKKKYHFKKISSKNELTPLKNQWIKTLTRPQDGMWESFRNSAVDWEIKSETNLIGYASVNEENQLLQFYVSPSHLHEGIIIFEQFIQHTKIKSGIVGTNNSIFLTIVLHFVKKVSVNTYLFNHHFETSIEEKEGDLKECKLEDKNRIVDFCHYSVGAPKEWLEGYIGNLIKRKEIFVLEKESKIIGTCEVRKSVSAIGFADVGMIVSPDFRREGYGTYLLGKAKEIAIEQGKMPICSCEKDNMGSLKSIHKNGFISMHQLLMITF